MDATQYKAERFRLDAPTNQNLIDLATWAENTALPWLWNELTGILAGTRITPLQPQDAIRQGLQTTFADRNMMPLKSSFYVAQLTMMDSELRRYCAAVGRFVADPQPYAPNATIYALHSAVKTCLDHGLILLEQAGHLLLNLPYAYGAWARRIEDSFEVFKGAEQIVYGRFSYLTHADPAPFTPIAVLRTAIEIRIRSAFGIQGYVDPSNENLVPIDLSSLLDEIRPHLPSIEFAVYFHDIVKVYKWSNFYLHSGWRDFVWVPGYALQFLRPLFGNSKPTPGGGMSLDGGIRMPRAVWQAVRKSFDGSGGRSENLILELWSEIWKVMRRRVRDRRLILNEAEEHDARCVFLD